jgi:hypothetical protein
MASKSEPQPGKNENIVKQEPQAYVSMSQDAEPDHQRKHRFRPERELAKLRREHKEMKREIERLRHILEPSPSSTAAEDVTKSKAPLSNTASGGLDNIDVRPQLQPDTIADTSTTPNDNTNPYIGTFQKLTRSERKLERLRALKHLDVLGIRATHIRKLTAAEHQLPRNHGLYRLRNLNISGKVPIPRTFEDEANQGQSRARRLREIHCHGKNPQSIS